MSTQWIGRGERVGGELGGGGENWKGNQKEGRGNQSRGVKREKERKKFWASYRWEPGHFLVAGSGEALGLRLGLRFSSRQKVISPIRCVQQRGTSFVETFGTDALRMVIRAIAGNKRREYEYPIKTTMPDFVVRIRTRGFRPWSCWILELCCPQFSGRDTPSMNSQTRSPPPSDTRNIPFLCWHEHTGTSQLLTGIVTRTQARCCRGMAR